MVEVGSVEYLQSVHFPPSVYGGIAVGLINTPTFSSPSLKPPPKIMCLSPSPSSAPAAAAASSTQACAACKYQRRKCHPDCTLAPYFPADQQQTFLNAHRLFGVSNILKTLKSLSPSVHRDAMRSIIVQSNIRAQEPVLGCVGVILELQRLVNCHCEELNRVHQDIRFYRDHLHRQAPDVSALVLNDEPPQQNGLCDYDNVGGQYFNYHFAVDDDQDPNQHGNIGNGGTTTAPTTAGTPTPTTTAGTPTAAAATATPHQHHSDGSSNLTFMVPASQVDGGFFDVKEETFLIDNEQHNKIGAQPPLSFQYCKRTMEQVQQPRCKIRS